MVDGRQASSRRGSASRRKKRTKASLRTRAGNMLRALPGNRYGSACVVLVLVLFVASVKLIYVQAFQAEALSARAERQRATVIEIPAQRGAILDRNGTELAFSVKTYTLQVNLRQMRKTWAEVAGRTKNEQTYADRVDEIAEYMAAMLPGKTTKQELLKRFHKDAPFTFLVDNVEPSVAEQITSRYPEIAAEERALREYPGGELASNVVGYANWRMDDPDVSKHNLHGLIGLESARDNDLAGKPGRRLVDTGEGDNVVIPGTERDIQPAVPGSDLELTLDSDLQYDLQRRLRDYVEQSRAKGGSAVIMDARTGEVYALANDKTFDPDNLSAATEEELNNRAVTTPFEPGSVNKVVTAAAAIEYGITTPKSVHQVPGQIQVADRVVRDAWPHPTQGFTTTGIFAKSSNVGTLMLARQVGEERWLEIARRFGLGKRTGIGLPGESPGRVPPRSQWSGSTFGNLPIGQGLSVTVVQMAGMYQAIANGGVRVEPRIVRATIRPDGTRVPEPPPGKVRVVSKRTADTVLRMLRATTQKGEGQNTGTAPQAALAGYQISGKTGTGQQVDPATGAYSQTKYNITFAGIVPADEPRFVVGIMLDAPDTTLPQGASAAPLFHDIASYLTQRYQIPLSEREAPVVPLVVD